MERKEFTSGEAEPVEYGYRVPFYSIMELFIETLTGTCFELHVSPFETVISVKAKIQRLEGIPVSQQYLIWHNIELEDDYCLHDYSITDGCTLKLVLAMRGGPINTRRIAMDEPSFREMADYVDANQEEFFENLSTPPSAGNNGSNKQVTLLVYRDGDQLNFFRVVDRGDGTLTPLSESLSGGSICNMDDEEDIDVTVQQRQWTVSQMIENNITASKVKQLRNHMHNLNIKGSSNKKTKSTSYKVDDTPILPTASKDDSSSKLSLIKRQLSFTPKVSRELPLSPTTVRTNLLNLFEDIPPFQPLQSKVATVSKMAETHQPLSSAEGAQAETLSTVDMSTDTDSKLERVKRGKPDNKGDITERSQGEVSDGEVVVPSHRIPVKEVLTSGSSASVHTTASKTLSSSGTTITKAELLRARLNRIKQAMNKEEEHEADGGNILELSKRQPLLKLEKNDETSTREEQDIARNRSPRTERLLAALSKNGKKETSLSSDRTEKKPPVSSFPRFSSSLTQGLAFNRHDMYLRSYGLLPSPDLETSSDKSVKTSPLNSANTVIKQRNDDSGNVKPSQAQKILETPHGVKYTASGGLHFGRPWYDRTSLGPPSASMRNHSNVQDTNSDNPSSYSLFYPHHKDLKPISHTPQNTGQVKQKPKSTTTDSNCVGVKYPFSSYGRSTSSHWSTDKSATSEIQSTNANQEKHSEGSITFHDSKDKLSHHHPRPPSSSTNSTHVSRYQNRRRLPKGSSDKSHAAQNPTTTSAVRMTDSPHGKLETMSRQEAREVVDFINKAMDPSILRTLVKSPGKETFRGSSGHSSYRHAPFHHYSEQTSQGDAGSVYNPLNNSINPKVNITPLGMPRVSNNSAHSRVGLHGPPTAGANRLLPPVKPVAKKKRCFLCGKKTGLATSYTCRCGNNFCATHRYAETHDCTYDYKTRGRKLLEESNPLVSAPKLPKI